MKTINLNRKKVLCILVYGFFFQLAQAQYSETIRTGRPGQSIGAFTVGKNILQFQQGVDFAESRHEFTQKSFVFDNVIRFGITENIELSGLVDYTSSKEKHSNYSTEGISDFHLGFRAHLLDQRKAIPNIAFQMRMKTLWVSKDFKINNIAPAMNLVMAWGLPKKNSVTTNWILSYNGNDAVPKFQAIFNYGFGLSDKWSGFIENYNTWKSSTFEAKFDGGFAYLLTPDIQFDISGGYGKNNSVSDFFIDGGISWRLTQWRKDKL